MIAKIMHKDFPRACWGPRRERAVVVPFEHETVLVA
jgi:hypothetical protein